MYAWRFNATARELFKEAAASGRAHKSSRRSFSAASPALEERTSTNVEPQSDRRLLIRT